MCMILDINMWPDFFNKTIAMQSVHKWLEKKNGKLVYSNHELFQKELTQNQRTALQEYSRKGQARLVPKKQVEQKITSLRADNTFKSNDIHILGLAKAVRVKVLCTKDKDLHYDFKHILHGHIYQNASHQHLLTKDTCP